MAPKIPCRASLCAAACVGGLAIGACGDSAGVDAADRFVDVAAGARHACALTASGQAFCWGTNEFGQLGNPTYTSSALPIPTEATPPLASLSAGFNHTCAVSRDGRVYCWGSNASGELGDGTRTARPSPTLVQGAIAFASVSAGEAHTCAVGTDGAGYCWGAPLGAIPGVDGRPPDALQPARLALPALAALSAGYEIACAVAAGSGATYCWGQYPPGVALDSGESSRGIPQLISPAPALVSASAGFKHACGLGGDGTTYCWGRNASGETGVGTIGDTVASPTAVAGEHAFVTVAAHAPSHTCAIDADGRAWCWGSNAFGQLGDGTGTGSSVPVAVAGGHTFSVIATGFEYTCGIATDERAYCWGAGGLGQLGNGETADSPVPVAVGAR